jgi:hypothetical protein
MTLQSWLDKGFAGVTLLMGSEGSLNLKYLTGNKEKQQCIRWCLGWRQDITERLFRWSFWKLISLVVIWILLSLYSFPWHFEYDWFTKTGREMRRWKEFIVERRG